MQSSHTEKAFESAIEDCLLSRGKGTGKINVRKEEREQ